MKLTNNEYSIKVSQEITNKISTVTDETTAYRQSQFQSAINKLILLNNVDYYEMLNLKNTVSVKLFSNNNTKCLCFFLEKHNGKVSIMHFLSNFSYLSKYSVIGDDEEKRIRVYEDKINDFNNNNQKQIKALVKHLNEIVDNYLLVSDLKRNDKNGRYTFKTKFGVVGSNKKSLYLKNMKLLNVDKDLVFNLAFVLKQQYKK